MFFSIFQLVIRANSRNIAAKYERYPSLSYLQSSVSSSDFCRSMVSLQASGTLREKPPFIPFLGNRVFTMGLWILQFFFPTALIYSPVFP